jgi:hypothetical protein
MEKISESKLYEYSNNDTGITIVAYLGFERYIKIPDSIDGNTVTEIGDKAFVNCKEAAGISIPVTVTVIGIEAFRGCDNLYSIIIPNSVEEIGTDCFKGCIKLCVWCNEGSFALKYARHNDLAVERYEAENGFDKQLFRIVSCWEGIADRFEMPLKLFIKRSKPRICKDSLIIYTYDGMDYEVLSGKIGEIRNLFSTFGDKYVKVIIECSE